MDNSNKQDIYTEKELANRQLNISKSQINELHGIEKREKFQSFSLFIALISFTGFFTLLKF